MLFPEGLIIRVKRFPGIGPVAKPPLYVMSNYHFIRHGNGALREYCARRLMHSAHYVPVGNQVWLAAWRVHDKASRRTDLMSIASQAQ